jgi:hypothetical protein
MYNKTSCEETNNIKEEINNTINVPIKKYAQRKDM